MIGSDLDQTEIMERVIKPVRIEVEKRGGYDVLVIEDSVGNQFTTLRDDLVENIFENKDEYTDQPWTILWSVTKEGYINFHGFLQKGSENEVNEEEIDPEDFEIVRPDRMGLSRTDIKITRQSAGHDASRIVSGKLASGKQLSDEEIKVELKKWSEYLKSYYRTGEWK
jgi:hypothetical protein